MNKLLITSVIIIIFSFLIGAYFYTILPDKLASHWNALGQADGYSSKFFGLFAIPIISLVIFFVLLIVPKIDPKKKNIEKFKSRYYLLILIFIIFFFYLYLLTILYNLNIKFNFLQFLIPAFAFLFFYLGTLIEHTKQNFSIGIRTPWTLSSVYVWEKTHKLGGKLFKISALISLIGIIFPKYGIYFLIIPILISAFSTILYSYLIFRKKHK